jgi:hypothetical protein
MSIRAADGYGDGAEVVGRTPPFNAVWYVQRSGIPLRRLRWCDKCGIVAPAVDDYQREQLDARGFVDDGRRCLCPTCAKGGR